MNQTLALTAAALLTATGAIAMSSADTNGDGVLTLDEVKAVLPEVSEDMFSAADADGNGVLSEGEISDATLAGVLPSMDG
jgi:hypothetical protein